MSEALIVGTPGVSNAQQTNWRVVGRGGRPFTYLASGKLIDGTKAADPGNTLGTTNTDCLRAGCLMGKITASSKYGSSIMGTLTVASLASATSLTVAAATAVELVRRIGSSGTFNLVGPPTAAGTVASETVTYSAVNTTTGVITCSAVTAAFILGSFVCPTDGSQTILSFIPDGGVRKVSDANNTRCDTPWPDFPIDGPVACSQLINWPTDTSLQTYIANALTVQGGPQFDLDYRF